MIILQFILTGDAIKVSKGCYKSFEEDVVEKRQELYSSVMKETGL